MESTSALCDYAGQQLLLTGRILTPEEIVARLEAVTAADVQRVAGEVLGRGLRGAVVGPFKAEARFEALLTESV